MILIMSAEPLKCKNIKLLSCWKIRAQVMFTTRSPFTMVHDKPSLIVLPNCLSRSMRTSCACCSSPTDEYVFDRRTDAAIIFDFRSGKRDFIRSYNCCDRAESRRVRAPESIATRKKRKIPRSNHSDQWDTHCTWPEKVDEVFHSRRPVVVLHRTSTCARDNQSKSAIASMIIQICHQLTNRPSCRRSSLFFCQPHWK